MIVALVESLGRWMIEGVESIGRFWQVALRGAALSLRPPLRWNLTMRQMEFVGAKSMSIIIVTGFFIGGVFSLQAAYGFGLFGADSLTGSTVSISLGRSLGPVFCSLMVTGRAGSAMAAEIGTMRVTEQLDALEAMAVDPVEYLVSPRIVAGTVMLPILSAIFTAVGMVGTYVVCVPYLDMNAGAWWSRVQWYADPDDLLWGLVKAAVFGFVLSSVGCYKGLSVRGGAQGVGQATTEAVVVASVSILVLDYFFTDILMKLGLLT